jgi:branched-chain amino acid transport system permease protein
MMSLLLQVVVTGLAAGAGYGLVAIGYTLIYRLTGVVHFALGELISLSVFATLFFAAGTGPVTRTNLGAARFVSALLGGLAVAVVSGGLVYILALRPFLRRESLIGWVGVLVAVTFGIRGFLSSAFVRTSYVFPDPIPFTRLGRGGVLDLGGGVSLQIRTFFVLGVAVAIAAGAGWVLTKTKFGKALQAISDTQEGAQLVGIPVDRLLALAFALAGALAAVAALVQAPSAPVSVDTGALLGLKGLVAALIVGFASSWRAFWAGLAVGILEAAVAALHIGPLKLGPQYRDIIPLVLAVVVIAFARLRETAVEVE